MRSDAFRALVRPSPSPRPGIAQWASKKPKTERSPATRARNDCSTPSGNHCFVGRSFDHGMQHQTEQHSEQKQIHRRPPFRYLDSKLNSCNMSEKRHQDNAVGQDSKLLQ